MSLAGFLIGRHTSRAEIAAETPIFHALATAETPIFYALTTAHDTPRHRLARDAEPTVQVGHRLHRTAEVYRDSATAPLPIVATTQPHPAGSTMTRSSQPTRSANIPDTPKAPPTSSPSASNEHPEQPARAGRHHLLLSLPRLTSPARNRHR